MKQFIRANRGTVLFNVSKATHFAISVSSTIKLVDGASVTKYWACLYAYINVGDKSQDFLVKRIEISSPDDIDDVNSGVKTALYGALE